MIQLHALTTSFCAPIPPPRYDGHIHLLGYPFLDSKEEFVHSTEACDVMHPRNNDPPLSVIDLSKVTVGSIQQLLKETEFFGFPCVLTASTQLLDGYITRKDLQYVVGMFLISSLSPWKFGHLSV